MIRRLLRVLVLGGLALLVLGVVAYHVLDLLFPFPTAALSTGPASPVVTARDGRALRVGLTEDDERCLPLDPGPLPAHLVHALQAQEDRRFAAHAGVDARALMRALGATLAGRREGGSTLSMQAARLVCPVPRTLAGKAVQVFRALQLEQHASKDEILRLYLDRVPLGGNLRGAGAAAAAWFGKRPGDLTAAEAALIVSVLPAPARYGPARDPAGARARRDRVLRAMAEEGWLDAAALARAQAAPLGLVRTPFANHAPDAALQVREGPSTLDLPLQQALERLAAAAPDPDGLALVLLEHVPGEAPRVRALVGGREASAARLDATRRPRAAGSTLKPFLWAAALDAGAIAPGTRLLDLPWSSPEWAPQDAEPGERGPVPAAQALAASWNLPAVRVALALPPGRFVGVLRAAGLSRVREADDRALDLALGTDDVTPLELAGAYAALAQGGLHAPPTLRADAPPAAPRRVCSPGAAALVLEALADPARPRPEGAPTAGVAWKTGTSSRRRDAWAAGVTRRFTAVVWRGRLDGQPDSALVGQRAAAPLLFACLAAADPAPAPLPAPREVRTVRVCAETGLAAGPCCPQVASDRVPAAAAPLRPCDVHAEVLQEAATGRLCCAGCREGRSVVARPLALFGAQEAAWRRRQGLALPEVPEHVAGCRAPAEPAALAPVFVLPRPGASLGAEEPVLVRAASAEGGPLRLLLDGEPLLTLPDDTPTPVRLPPGRRTLTLLTRSGRSATLSLEVLPGRLAGA